ncbi:MAG: hypothetical protein P1S60_02220 [Anaerolineae bacterium]|nr:hypothetical protein [Anaerolineae bacterium]
MYPLMHVTRKRLITSILIAQILVFSVSLPIVFPASATTYTVVNTNDSGAGSLRDAIDMANANSGPDTITFNIPGTDPNCVAGVCTIQPVTDLPPLTDDGTTIDGYPNMGATYASGTTPAALKIVLDGTNTIARGLYIRSSDNVITGLVIHGFTLYGIDITRYLTAASGNVISGNHIGTDVAGSVAAGNGVGVAIRLGATGNTIGGDTDAGRNVISGNGEGIFVTGSTYATHDNIIKGNWIGVTATGSEALPNSGNGIQMVSGAYSNIIGPDNVISGNVSSGIDIWWTGTDGNGIKGNFIGTDATGTYAIPNVAFNGGIYIHNGAQGNVIGGDTSAERNVISGNAGRGIRISGSGTDLTVISANIIGLDISGTSALLNGREGVSVANGAANTTIGGATDGEGNVIVADYPAIELEVGAHDNTVSANLLGTDISGMVGLGGGIGVEISSGAYNNTIGGTTPAERNVISGNGDSIGGFGVRINDADGNELLRNFIGVDITGSGPLPNGPGSSTGTGVKIENGAQSNTIGPYNIIANHPGDGISISGSTTDFNFITRNSIYANGINIAPDGANEGITAPTVDSVSLSFLSVSGHTSPACIGCTIEVFTGPSSSEGKTYLGTGTTDAVGDWTVITPGLHGPYITATLTDAAKGTSIFSGGLLTEITATYLPLIQR